MFRFNSWYFLFLIPFFIWLFLKNEKKEFIKFSDLKLFKEKGQRTKYKHKIGKWLILLSVILFTLALARPQFGNKMMNEKKKGIDIILALDVSGSMESIDIKPNRLEAAKEVVSSFVGNRENDRIGLVIFSGAAYTRLPLTTDYSVIKESVEILKKEDVNANGTAIGMGLAVAVNRLKNSDAKSKIIILLTDGQNNAGSLSPESSVELAKRLNIKVYTIGVGTDFDILPERDFWGNTNYVKKPGGLDEKTLKYIADNTGAKYYRADSKKSFQDIFKEIDNLEKTNLNVKNIFEYKELYKSLVLLGMIILIIGFYLESVLFIKIP